MKKQIGIIGQGYVGLSLAMSALKAGYRVVGFDSNPKLIEKLERGETEVPSVDIDFMQEKSSLNLYNPTFDPNELNESEIIIIAVPTPLNHDRIPDLSFLIKACEIIVDNLKNDALIINESTSYPGTLREVIKKICDTSKKAIFTYASAPERIDPGNKIWNISNTPRIVSGLSEIAKRQVVAFYNHICTEVVLVDTPEVAEASKLYENTFRQVNIALANEFSIICKNLGISSHAAIAAAATKPFGFMAFYPSIGVGGHCIPIDPSYLSFAANQVGIRANFIELANETNLSMARHVVERINNFLGKPLLNLNIQLIGISYKIDVADLRESPALILISELRSKGAVVKWHDPLVNVWNNENSSQIDPNIDLGLIVTPHKSIDLSVWKKSKTKVLDLSANSNDYGWPKFL